LKKESRIFFSKFFIVVYLLAFLFAIYVFFAISCAIGIVDGNSMSPTLNNGDVFIYTKESQIHRLNVVAIRSKDTGETIVKRIIGLPNEQVCIRDGYIYINGLQLSDVVTVYTDPGVCGANYILGPNEYFVIGDNRGVSVDSRAFGAVTSMEILGVLMGDH